MGEPDAPGSVSMLCLNSKLFIISITLPLATSISSLGYCKVNISIFLYWSYPFI